MPPEAPRRPGGTGAAVADPGIAGAWLGAPVGLVRADGTKEPSYDALHGLVEDEWWLAETPMRTDDQGGLRVAGWLGDDCLSAGGETVPFALDAPGPSTST